MNTLESIKHFFIPRESNNFRAKGLHVDTLTIFLFIAIGLSFFTQLSKSHILGIATDITIGKLLEDTNKIRYENGLPPLSYNQKLADAAANKAADMLSCGYWAHMRPDSCPGGSATPWDFISKSGYQYEVAGENLAHGFLLSDEVVDAWKASPSHMANLIRPEYNEVGFAVMNGTLEGEETTLVVQMFGKQLARNTTPNETSPAQNNIVQDTSPIVEKQKAPENGKVVLSQVSKNNDTMQSLQKSSFISLQQLSFDSSMIIFGIILLVLALDFYFAYRFQIIRVNGKNMAHIAFLLLIILGLFIIKAGAII